MPENYFYTFLVKNREEILAYARKMAKDSTILTPTKSELEYGIPLFFDQFTSSIKWTTDVHGRFDEHMRLSASNYGTQIFDLGFTISQIVQSYGTICESILTVAKEHHQKFQPQDHLLMNVWLDEAIASAASGFDIAKTDKIEEEYTYKFKKIEDTHAVQIGELVHELRRELARAILTFDILKMGKVGIQSRTSHVLEGSLHGLRKIIDLTVAQVLLKVKYELNIQNIRLAELLDETVFTLKGLADKKEIKLICQADHSVQFAGDRQLLDSAIENIVENAIKYSKTKGIVQVKGMKDKDRIKIEVTDECGGMPEDKIEHILEPFTRGSASEGGMGLGLSITSQALKKHGGHIFLNNIPGKGCIFTLEIPEGQSKVYEMDMTPASDNSRS
jgi:signal transduction histidine kinase